MHTKPLLGHDEQPCLCSASEAQGCMHVTSLWCQTAKPNSRRTQLKTYKSFYAQMQHRSTCSIVVKCATCSCHWLALAASSWPGTDLNASAKMVLLVTAMLSSKGAACVRRNCAATGDRRRATEHHNKDIALKQQRLTQIK